MQNISVVHENVHIMTTTDRTCAFIQISFRSDRLKEKKSVGHTALVRITLIARASHGSNRLYAFRAAYICANARPESWLVGLISPNFYE